MQPNIGTNLRNCTLSTFPGGWGWGSAGVGWGGVVGKCVTKENPKSDLDLDEGFVNLIESEILKKTN